MNDIRTKAAARRRITIGMAIVTLLFASAALHAQNEKERKKGYESEEDAGLEGDAADGNDLSSPAAAP